MESFFSLIAGFAFFLVGIKLFNANLNQLTTARFRSFIAKFTPNDWIAGIWGFILSILTAGNTFLTPCIAGGLAKVGAINTRKALQIVIWSRVGACLYIFVAGFDFKLAVLCAIGISGISFALGKPKKLSTFTASVFNLAMVLFGIQLIKSSTKILSHYPWFHTIIEYTDMYPIIALATGFLFLLCSQSLFGALVVALSFYSSGIFSINEVLLFIYGLYLAEAVLKYMYLPAFTNTFKDVIALFLAIYFFAFFIGIGSYLIENVFHIPLFQYFSTHISSQPKIQLAIINLSIHLVTAVSCSIMISAIQHRFLPHFHKEVEEVGVITPLEIPVQVLDSPATTVSLIEEDHVRIAKELSTYMENMRSGKSITNTELQENLHSQLFTCLDTVHSYFTTMITRSNYSPRLSSTLLTKLECHNSLIALEESVYNFSVLIDKIRHHHFGDDTERKIFNFVEAFDILLLSMTDVLENPHEHFNEEIILEATKARENILKNIRNQYALSLPAVERLDLIELINLFEKSIWLINKICRLHLESVDIDLKTTTTKVATSRLFQKISS